jgi:hypothetical protein
MKVGVVGVTMLWFRKGGSSQIAVEVKIYIPFVRDHGDLVKTHGPQASRTIPMIHTGSNILDDLLRVESHMAAQILALVVLALIWGLIALPNCDSLDVKLEKKSVDDSSSGVECIKGGKPSCFEVYEQTCKGPSALLAATDFGDPLKDLQDKPKNAETRLEMTISCF